MRKRKRVKSCLPGLQDMITGHALRRMNQRGIRLWQVDAVMEYGRCIYARGARIMLLGYREVQHAKEHGIDLQDCNGIQVVTSPSTGGVKTVYRNRDLRGLRPCRRRGRRR